MLTVPFHAEPQSAMAFLAELERCKGADARLDGLTRELKAELVRAADGSLDPTTLMRRGRLLVDKMALALEASALIQSPTLPPALAQVWHSALNAELTPALC